MRVFLFDMNNMFWRNVFAMDDLRVAGFHTGGMFGVLKGLVEVKEKNPDSKIVCIWDGFGGSRWRKDRMKIAIKNGVIESGYKSNRPEKDEDHLQQLSIVRKTLIDSGFPCVTIDGEEADDVIYTLAMRYKKSGERVCVVSTDKDFYQLIRKGVTVYNPTIDYTFTRKKFTEKYGVAPKFWVHVKALMGDKGDNIPGAPGVGEKTALKLIIQYGDLDAVIEACKAIDEGKRKKYEQSIIDSEEIVRLALELVKFRKCKARESNGIVDVKSLISFARKYKFASIRNRLNVFSEGYECS